MLDFRELKILGGISMGKLLFAISMMVVSGLVACGGDSSPPTMGDKVIEARQVGVYFEFGTVWDSERQVDIRVLKYVDLSATGSTEAEYVAAIKALREFANTIGESNLGNKEEAHGLVRDAIARIQGWRAELRKNK